jgi:precorrin-6B methylase 2
MNGGTMSKRIHAAALALAVIAAGYALRTSGAAQAQDARAERENARYEAGTQALDDERWDEAIAAFGDVVAVGGGRADAGLYWKAYAQRKAGRTVDALATLAELRRRAPKSQWIDEAQALELEIRQAAGVRVAPETAPDEDLKLIALNGLMHTDSARALPLLKEFLSSNRSPKLRQQALFVLSQSPTPEARTLIADIARGRVHPDLQSKAIQNLGLFGGPESKQALADIYAGTADIEVKKAVLQAFMVSGEKGRVLALARTERSPELRKAAIQQLGVMGAQTELGEMYKNETDVEVKKTILHGLFIGGGADRLLELLRTEKDPELRRALVHNLGLMGRERTGEALANLYRTETDARIRGEVLNAFFIQGNAQALVQIARTEKDPELRREAVSKLSLMSSNKEALDFMMELLK